MIVLRDVTREVIADQFKHDIVSSVSHELRTPLTSIKGYVDLLLLGAAGELSEGQMSFLSVVKNNANRLMDLINDILEVGRIDSDKIELMFSQVNLTKIIEDVLQALRHEIEAKALDVTVNIHSELPSVEADERRLTKVLFELVKNAIRFTPTEGKIEVYGYLNPSNMLAVDVVDTGIGIDPADQEHVFQRFWRQSRITSNGQGVGLGLTIAQALVEMHGGAMWLQSMVGVGSKFSFAIPLAHGNVGHEST